MKLIMVMAPASRLLRYAIITGRLPYLLDCNMKFLGMNKVQFNVAGNLEPSLVLKSNAYMLSSEGNNYVNDPSLLRKLNLSSNFGAFVTFSSAEIQMADRP